MGGPILQVRVGALGLTCSDRSMETVGRIMRRAEGLGAGRVRAEERGRGRTEEDERTRRNNRFCHYIPAVFSYKKPPPLLSIARHQDPHKSYHKKYKFRAWDQISEVFSIFLWQRE